MTIRKHLVAPLGAGLGTVRKPVIISMNVCSLPARLTSLRVGPNLVRLAYGLKQVLIPVRVLGATRLILARP